MIEVAVGCEFQFVAAHPTHAVVVVEPHLSERHRILRQRFSVQPEATSSGYLDLFGNWCRRLTLPGGEATLRFDALVETSESADDVEEGALEHPPAELPDDVLVFLLPSRYCPSDTIADFAFQQFGAHPPGWGRVEAISAWVHEHVRFDYMSASPSATSADVFESGAGVCRDFAHLGIALCRALNIPARYVFGYLPDIGVPDLGMPMDFCAWLEVYVGGRWFTFDPRNHQHRVGRTVIGRGRDAADVAMVTTFGSVELRKMTVVAEPVADLAG